MIIVIILNNNDRWKVKLALVQETACWTVPVDIVGTH
jgi:hypothetical protein